ncbi:MAG: ABC transporter permease subunit [Nitrososphaerota archaeon]|nr:ABC transporter permease subunit [Nitrososphaerota archaeon]
MSDVIPGLVVDTAYSWVRMFVALALSILFSWCVGIAAGRNRTAERLILPALDVLQSIPILGFFPIVLVVFVSYLPLSLGVNLSVTFLIFTSMSWNIAFSVYESVKSIPADYLDLTRMERMSLWRRVTELYIPATWGKVAYNSATSWSVGLFYLISSEMFSLGNSAYSVKHGIGVDIATFASQHRWGDYALAIGVLIAAVMLTRFLFLGEFSSWSEKFKLGEESRPPKKDPIYRFYSWFNAATRAKVSSALPRGRHLRIPSVKLQKGSTDLRRLVRAVQVVLLALLAAVAVAAAFSAAPNMNLGQLGADEAEVLVAMAYSFLRVWYVYAITAAIALPLGICIAVSDRALHAVTPLLQVVSAVPASALLFPVALFVSTLPFSGEITAAIVIFLGMVWYLIFNVIAGVRAIPSEIRDTARLLKVGRWNFWRHVYIPAALPSFITGSITAVGGAWNTLIIAEYYVVSTRGGGATPITQVSLGLGKLLDLATQGGNITLIGLCVLTMSLFIVTFNIAVWRRLYNRTTKRYSYGG